MVVQTRDRAYRLNVYADETGRIFTDNGSPVTDRAPLRDIGRCLAELGVHAADLLPRRLPDPLLDGMYADHPHDVD